MAALPAVGTSGRPAGRRFAAARRGRQRGGHAGGANATGDADRAGDEVAAGNANPDIAAELFLSRRTVEGHVSHILTKLDARSRVDIARLAAHH
jgi:hypothetical protein